MTKHTTPTSGAADLLAMVSKALREAYNLGMMYWQQADSDYISQHKKSDDTKPSSWHWSKKPAPHLLQGRPQQRMQWDRRASKEVCDAYQNR